MPEILVNILLFICGESA